MLCLVHATAYIYMDTYAQRCTNLDSSVLGDQNHVDYGVCQKMNYPSFWCCSNGNPGRFQLPATVHRASTSEAKQRLIQWQAHQHDWEHVA